MVDALPLLHSTATTVGNAWAPSYRGIRHGLSAYNGGRLLGNRA